MKAKIIQFNDDQASNGGSSDMMLCIDRHTHLKIKEFWHEEYDTNERGNEFGFDSSSNTAEVSKCNCHFRPEVELTDEHAKLVEQFLATGSSPDLVHHESLNFRKEEGTPGDYINDADQSGFGMELSEVPGKNDLRELYYSGSEE